MSFIKEKFVKWNWLLMILFLLFSIINPIWGLGALLCIIPALIISFRDRRKIFCGFYCPRGNFLNKLFYNLSFNKSVPKLFVNKNFRFLFFILMFSFFMYSLFKTDGSLSQVGFVFFRFIFTSTIIGSLMGIFFKPRSWCQICPFGYATELVIKPVKLNEVGIIGKLSAGIIVLFFINMFFLDYKYHNYSSDNGYISNNFTCYTLENVRKQYRRGNYREKIKNHKGFICSNNIYFYNFDIIGYIGIVY